jgi:hypothetical protein
MAITSGDRTLQFSLTSDDPFFCYETNVHISNMQRAPYFSINGEPSVLTDYEAKLIEQLHDVCNYYCEHGDPKLSDLVDKIGMNLMQSFLSRGTNVAAHPIRNQRPE